MHKRFEIARRGSGAAFYVIGDGERLRDIAENVTCGVTIVGVPVDDWNGQLSPWPAPACFRGAGDFGGGAGEYLRALEKAVPEFEKENGLQPDFRVICGYSLAGLCALYALYVTGMFAGAVSASGSLWFDGWLDYMQSHVPVSDARVYLSVGDREARTRNARLAAVEECTLRACGILRACGADAEFYLENGNHFNEPGKRVARGIERVYGMLTKA